ncbi:hypothetical protein K3495_g14803, partial [Podosphaera aphanis]
MVDTGCLCFSVVDENLVRSNDLCSEVIPPRQMRLADGKKTNGINRIARFEMDIDGRKEQVWSYVMPNLAYSIILGKPWMEKNDVHYSARRRCLRIGSRKHGLVVRSSGWYESESQTKINRRISRFGINQVKLASGEEFTELWRQNNNIEENTIGAISIHDITRALEPKKVPSRLEVERNLPKELRKYTDLFLDDNLREDEVLPPHRAGVDTKVRLQKDSEGRDKEVPWGPLYGMTREELLVLRKTLTELLGKNWIRASSSPGGAPVLFIKKPNGGLRFCVDYRALNAITERDRYPLPLMQETLKMVSKAKWISKV